MTNADVGKCWVRWWSSEAGGGSVGAFQRRGDQAQGWDRLQVEHEQPQGKGLSTCSL